MSFFIRLRNLFFPFIHSANDGRGIRSVYLNGAKVKATYCNTLTGYIEFYKNPHLPNTVEKTFGKVKVEWPIR